MAEKLDMGLDDIIKQNKPKGGRGGRGAAAAGGRGGRGRGAGGGAAARGFGGRRGAGLSRRGGLGGIRKRRSGGPMRPNTFKALNTSGASDNWAHDLFEQGARRASGGATGLTKVQVTNLDYGVNDKDIKDLFEEYGIRKAAVHYDRSGRSLGTAHVIFEKRVDALRAIKAYNGVRLDNREMKLELIAAPGAAPASAVGARNGSAGFGGVRRGQGPRRGFRGRGRGRRFGGGNRGAQNGQGNKTKEQLDADLDSYNSMQTD